MGCPIGDDAIWALRLACAFGLRTTYRMPRRVITTYRSDNARKRVGPDWIWMEKKREIER